MKIFRWIIGIPAPYAVAIGLELLLSGLQHSSIPGSFAYIILLALKDFTIFFLIVFLSCLLIPAPKRYTAATSVILNIVIIISISIGVSLQAAGEPSRLSATILLMDAACSFAGLTAGTATAYTIFKNKGWRPSKRGIATQRAG